MVYTRFSRVIDAFLKEQVGPTVAVSRFTKCDLDMCMTNPHSLIEREHSSHQDRTNSLWSAY